MHEYQDCSNIRLFGNTTGEQYDTMPALYDFLQGVQQGNRSGESMTQGMRPSGPQPQGAPQMAVVAASRLKAEISQLNSIAEMFRNSTLLNSNKYVLDVIECTRKLQAVVVAVEKDQQEMQQQQSNRQIAMGQ